MYSPKRSKTIDRSFMSASSLRGFYSGADATWFRFSVRRGVGHAREPGDDRPPGRGARLVVAVGGPTAVLPPRAPRRLRVGAGPAVAGAVRVGGRRDRDAGPRRRCHDTDP